MDYLAAIGCMETHIHACYVSLSSLYSLLQAIKPVKEEPMGSVQTIDGVKMVSFEAAHTDNLRIWDKVWSLKEEIDEALDMVRGLQDLITADRDLDGIVPPSFSELLLATEKLIHHLAKAKHN